MSSSHQPRHYHTLIVGAGFSGLCMAIQLQKNNLNDFLVIEKSDHVGGTWWENKYPGAECDVESHLYSFSFEPNPNWSRIFSGSDEIQQYLDNTANKYQIKKHIKFEEVVTEIIYYGKNSEHDDSDEEEEYWKVITNKQTYYAQFLVFSSAPLHFPNLPAIPGIKEFQGKILHTSKWDQKYDFKGKKVGMIGCAASGVQCVPYLSKQSKSLVVFQRTPQWITPKFNRNFTNVEKWFFRTFPCLMSFYRFSLFYSHEMFWNIFFKNSLLSKICSWGCLLWMSWIIKDPILQEKITPRYPMGCKRVLPSDDFYSCLNRSNVTFLTGNIEKITKTSLVEPNGKEYPIDILVLATGFDLTGGINNIKILNAAHNKENKKKEVHGKETKGKKKTTTDVNKDGKPADGKKKGKEAVEGYDDNMIPYHPVTSQYYGVYCPNMKNFFTLLGFNSGSTYTSVVLYAEAQVNHIVSVMKHMKETKKSTIEISPTTFKEFNESLQERSKVLVLDQCKSWYRRGDENIALYPYSVKHFAATLEGLDYEKTFIFE
jgi:cation diffusion facilitator CzcD-associated flavoprotein CzcO